MNDKYWYNIKEENGSILIEKKYKDEDNLDEVIIESNKKNYKPVLFILPILIIVPFLFFSLFYTTTSPKNDYKYRTFMIYMVGSDLESSGKIGTYDLEDISGSNINLDDNNILLMVGGSKQWHNFVSEDEVGIYELTKSGFKKVKTYKQSSMGSVDTLNDFLDYSVSNYKSDKYDFMFWNHGLGALGLEDDEVFEDYLSIQELKTVFDKSKFIEDKLEVIIFNNCLSGNIHFASVMKKYANIMVASEEVMYVGKIIDRLNFLNDINKDDNGYDIALSYVKKSDDSIRKASNKKNMDLDSTLSIIDLSKIDDVENNIDEFFNSIDIENNYKGISRARRRTKTYGQGDYSFDTVDLYSLVDSLSMYSEILLKEKVQKSIEDAVIYNSSFNEYSNGLSIYFPYYGSTDYISSHLYNFDKIWDNDYLKFIHSYFDLSNTAKKSNRAGKEGILTLTNDIKYENNQLSIELTGNEKDVFAKANVYIFKKTGNNFNLLLKTDDTVLDNNKIVLNDINLLKSTNNEVISSIKENGKYKIYGLIDGKDVVINIDNDHGHGIIKNILIDSKDKPVGGLFEYNNEEILYYSLKYNNFNKTINEEWNTDIDKNSINNINNDIDIVETDISNNYVLVEMFDINNDSFYSKVSQIK